MSHTFYSTQWGPMLILPPLANWTATNAYTLHDVNSGNVRGLTQYQQMGSARSMDEFVEAIETHVALPWVNTIAADRDGNAYYGDISTVPHVTDAKLAACANTFVAQVLSYGARVYTLDGSTSACDLGTDADSPQAGIFGASNLPSIRRDDFAQNSNNSYWLANPAQAARGLPADHRHRRGRPPEPAHAARSHADRGSHGRHRTACPARASTGSGSRTSSSRTATTAPSSCSTACARSAPRRTTTWTSAAA